METIMGCRSQSEHFPTPNDEFGVGKQLRGHRFGQMLTWSSVFRDINTFTSCVFYMSWFLAFDQFRQLLLRNKLKSKLRHIDEAPIRLKHVYLPAEYCVC